MADFMKLNARTEMRLNEYAMRLFQIEAHLRRGEPRAARARLAGMAEEVEAFARESSFPLPMVLIGAQLGLVSGGGSWVRGRLPGALVGGAAGWLVGHSLGSRHRRDLDEILACVAMLEQRLAAAESTTKADDLSNISPSSTISGQKRPGGVENKPGPA